MPNRRTVNASAAFEAKSVRRPWREELHPRDSKGRFVETGGIARLWGGGFARIVRALSQTQVQVSDLDGSNRRPMRTSRLTMVARPDGSAPTKSREKVQAEEARRDADPRRGNGLDHDDHGDPDTSDSPHDKDDEGTPIGADSEHEPRDDEPARKPPRFTSVAAARNHLESGTKDPRWKRPPRTHNGVHLRGASKQERAQVRIDTYSARPGLEFARNSQLSSGGNFLVTRHGQGKWDVYHVGSGTILTHQAGFRSKPDALHFANELEDARDRRGRPIDWEAPHLADRLDMAEGRDGIDGAIARGRSHDDHEDGGKQQNQAEPKHTPSVDQPMLGDDQEQRQAEQEQPRGGQDEPAVGGDDPTREGDGARLSTVAQVLDHWRTTPDVPRLRETHNERAQRESVARQRADLVSDPQVIDGYLIGKMDVRGKERWTVFHAGTSVPIAILPSDKGKPDAIARVHAYRDYRDDNGKPFDWRSDGIGERLSSPAGKRMLEITSGRTSHQPGRHETDAPETATELASFPGYRTARGEDGINVFGPDGKRIATGESVFDRNTRRSAYVGDMGDRHVSGRTESDFAVNAARQHVLAGQPDDHKDSIWIQYSPSRAVVHGTEKGDPDMRKRMRRAGFVWSDGAKAYVTTRTTRPVTRALAVDTLVRGFADEGRQIEVRRDEDRLRGPSAPAVDAPSSPAALQAPRRDQPHADRPDAGTPDLRSLTDSELEGFYRRAERDEKEALWDSDRKRGRDRDREIQARKDLVLEEMKRRDGAKYGASNAARTAVGEFNRDRGRYPVTIDGEDTDDAGLQGQDGAWRWNRLGYGTRYSSETTFRTRDAALADLIDEHDREHGGKDDRHTSNGPRAAADAPERDDRRDPVADGPEQHSATGATAEREVDDHADAPDAPYGQDGTTTYAEARDEIVALAEEWNKTGLHRDLTNGQGQSLATDLDTSFRRLGAAGGIRERVQASRELRRAAEAALASIDDEPGRDPYGKDRHVLEAIRDRAARHEQRLNATLNDRRDNKNERPAGPDAVPDSTGTDNQSTPDTTTGDSSGSEQARADRPEALGDVPAGGVRGDRDGGGEGGVLREARDGRQSGDHRTGESDPQASADERGIPGSGRGSDAGDGAGTGDRDARADLPADRARDGGRRAARSRQAVAAPSFRPTSQRDLAPSGEKARARANVAAVETLRRIQAEDRPATPAEQKILARWSGWGALPIVLADKPEPTDGAFRDADGNPDPAKYARALKKWESFAAERAAVRELLNDEEWNAAKANTLNAHYTDAELVKPLWDLVRELGFDGGTVLEPGSGSGNFIGAAPEGASVTGIELDPTTAAISQLLYPDARIINGSFGDVRMPNSYYDVAIGNVPFGRFPMYDEQVNPDLKHSIHDTFILKSLAKVRPGGLVAIITSRFTLDNEDDTARRQMSHMADLVGAVRLPAGAHQEAAGTGVVTDVLVFRRRFGDEHTHDIDMSWTRSSKTHVNGHEIAVNNYFQRHPEMILGQLTTGRGQFSDHDLTVVGDKNAGAALKAGLERIRRDVSHGDNRLRYVPEIDAVDRNLELAGEKHEGAVHVLSDGSFTQVEDGVVIPLDVHPTQQEQLRKLIGLRDLTDQLLRLEGATRETGETDKMRSLRRQLTEAYDTYVKQHGPIDKPGQTRFFSPQEAKDRAKAEGLKNVPDAWKLPSALQLFEDDPASAVAFGLDKWDDSSKSAKKADIFTQRVVAPREIADRADNPEQAIALAMERDGGELHLPSIARLLGRSDLEALREEIGPLAFDEPGTNRLVPRGEYLSGNVREKLALAEPAAAADPRFAANVAALKNVIPRDLEPSEIRVKMGVPWIGEGDITAFLQHILGTKAVRAEHGGGSVWEVRGPTQGIAATSDWGTTARPAPDIAKALLEQRTIVVNKTVKVGGREQSVRDEEATSAAQAKAKEMADRFSEWVWEDPERAQRLARVYNDRFNNLVLREFDDSPLALPGANAEWKMRPHQNAAIRRIVSEPSVLLAHVVGAGKTATMVAGTQELRRTGLARKPSIVVPNHMLGQFRREYLELYPNANLLTASSADLTGKKRRRFIAKAATGDWDAVILTQGAFERIPMRAEAQERYMRQELDKLEDEIKRAKAREGKSLTLKRLEETLKRKEAKLKARLASKKDQGAVHFEDTGIDYLMVDEAHGYKNLATASHIEGASIAGSARASDLHMKIEYLRERNETGRVVTLATGTPIANSVTEAYIMQRYLRPDVLEAAGVHDFDSWSATFGEIVQQLELAPDGSGFRMKARFARFHNAADLLRMYRLAVDVQTAADLDLPTPAVRKNAEGKRGEVVTIPISAEQKAYVTALPNAKWIRDKGGVLKAIGLASRAAIDMRLVGGHGEEGGKVDAAVRKIAEIYEENKDRIYPVSADDPTPQKRPGALQIVFMDAGTPGSKAKNAWDAYDHMKDQLVQAGVPPLQIKFIHEAKTDKAKAKLFEDARNGKIAVLIGSTEKMGTGTNIQDRAVALHHMDFPWRPADMAQREGRIERQGNLNMPEISGTADDVRIISYVTEETFDAFKLGTLERKAAFIAQMDRKGFDAREMEDIGDTAVSFGQMKAIATGDMTVMDYAQAGADVVELQRLDRNWHRDQDRRKATIRVADEIINDLSEVLPAWRDALASRTDVSGDNFRIRIGNEEYDQRADAYEHLAHAVRAAARNMRLQDGDRVQLGTLGGHGFHVEVDHDQFGNRVAKVRFDWPDWEHPSEPDTRGVYTPSQLDDASGRGILSSLERRLNNLDEAIEDAESSLEVAQDERGRARRGLGGVSPYGERLRSKERRVALLSDLITANEALKPFKGRQVDPADKNYMKAKQRVEELQGALGIEDRREAELDDEAAAAAQRLADDAVTLDRDRVEDDLAGIRPEGAARPRSRQRAVNDRGGSSPAGGTVTLDRDRVEDDLAGIRPTGGVSSAGSSEPPNAPEAPQQGDGGVPQPPVGTDSPRAMSPESLQAEIIALIEHEMAHGPLTGAAKTRLATLEAEKDRRAGKRPEREPAPKPTPQRSGPGGNWADLTREQFEGGGEDDGLFAADSPAGPRRAADPNHPLDLPDDATGTPDMFADAEGRDTRDLGEAEIRRADRLGQGDRFTDAGGRVHTVAEPPTKTGRGRVRIVTEEGRELFYRSTDEVRIGGDDTAQRNGAAAAEPVPDAVPEGSTDEFLGRPHNAEQQAEQQDPAAAVPADATSEQRPAPDVPSTTDDDPAAPEVDAASESDSPKYNAGDSVVTPRGTGYVVANSDDGVLVNENGTYQLYQERQLSRPGEERVPEPVDTSVEDKRRRDLAAATSPEGLDLPHDNARLANLNLEEGHGEVLDDDGNLIGWIRRRGTTWYGQDARGGIRSSTRWTEDGKGGPLRAAQLMAGIVAMGAHRDTTMLGGEPFRHIRPEDVVAPIFYSALSEAQSRELRALAAAWKNADDPELRTAANQWSRGISIAQMRLLANAIDDFADDVDVKSKEGRRRQGVLRRLAESIRDQAHASEGSFSTLPRPGEPDPWASPRRREADAPEGANAPDRSVAPEPDRVVEHGRDQADTPEEDRPESHRDEEAQRDDSAPKPPDGAESSRRRDREGRDADGHDPETSGAGAQTEDLVDEPADDGHDDERGRGRDRRDRRRRRDRNAPDAGAGAPGRPRIPHLPDLPQENDRQDDSGGDGRGSSPELGASSPALDALRQGYRSGTNLPADMDTPVHRDFLRRLADNPTLTLSTGGGLVTWSDDHDALAEGRPAQWYFAHARTGAGMGGAGNTSVTARSQTQARDLADRYEQLTDADGAPFNWNGDLDPVSVRSWRDAQGRNLPQAMRAARDAFEDDAAREEPSALPEDLGALADRDLESLAHQDLADEDWERLAAEMDRRHPPAQRLQDVLPPQPPATEEERAAENAAIDEALGFGGSDVASALVRPKRRSKDAILRDEYQLWHEERFNRAETAMRGGTMVNREGEHRGYTDEDVFNGGFLSSNDNWRRYASDELIEWFDANGGRVTYNQWRENMRRSERVDRDQHEQEQRRAREEATQPAAGTSADAPTGGGQRDASDGSVRRDAADGSVRRDAAAGPALAGGGAAEGRFASLDELRAHLRDEGLDEPSPTGVVPSRQQLNEIVSGGTLELSPGGRLAIAQYRHGQHGDGTWQIMAPGSMEVLAAGIADREQAIRYADALEGIRDRAGDPFAWDAPDAPQRARAFDGPRGESLGEAVARALVDAGSPEEQMPDLFGAQQVLGDLETLGEHYPKWRAAQERDGYTVPVYDPRDVRPGDEVASVRVGRDGAAPVSTERGTIAQDQDGVAYDSASAGGGGGLPLGLFAGYTANTGRGEADGVYDLDGTKIADLPGSGGLVHLVDDPARPRAMRRPRPGEAVPGGAEGRGAVGTPTARPRPDDASSAPAAAVPEQRSAPEPIGGRPAEWVSLDQLALGDVVRIDGTTRKGKPRTLSGYVIQAPQRREVSLRGRNTEMFMTLVSQTRDGSSGDRSPVWTPLDASAARATGEPDLDRPDTSLTTGAESDVLTGQFSDRIVSDPAGHGLFPGTLVRDGQGREGVISGANSATVSVHWANGKEEPGIAPTALTVTDGGAARPAGWTPQGQRLREGHVVSDRSGNLLGTVEAVEDDTAQVATREGMQPMPVGNLRAVGEVRDADRVGRASVDPTTAGDLTEGDVIVRDGASGPRPVTVIGRHEDGDRVQLDVADPRTGEIQHIDTAADAPVTRLTAPDGQTPAADDTADELKVREPTAPVTPVIGDTVDPDLSPEERDAIADHGTAASDNEDVQQAVARIGRDLPVTPQQAAGLADSLRATSSPDTADGRAAHRAADRLDAAAGRAQDGADAGPTPGTVEGLGVGDTVALPDEHDANSISTYTVVGIDDLLGGVRQVTVEDSTGARHSRTLQGDQPLWQLPELPVADSDAVQRDPNVPAAVGEIVAAHPNQVARAVVESAIAGTATAGSIHQLRQQIAERVTAQALLVPMQRARQESIDALNAAEIRGRERADAFRRLKEARLRARAAAIRAVLRTINDLEPLDGESEQDTARRAADLLRLIPDQVAGGSRPAGTGDAGATVARHIDDALAHAVRDVAGVELSDSDAARLGRLLSARMDATRQATARRVLRHLPAAQRQRLLPQVLAALIRIAQRIVAVFRALFKAAGQIWHADAFRRFRERLAERVKSWPEARLLHRLARSGDLPSPGDGAGLGERISHWARLLPAPGRFGQTSRRARWYQRTTRRALAAGELPTVQDGLRWAPDRAADRGPGALGLRHLAALRAAGTDMDNEISRRLAAAAPDLGDDPHASLRDAAAYADSAERRARDLAAHPVGHSVNPDYPLELTAARVEAVDARAEAERMRAAYAAALPGVVADALAAVREMGPEGTSALVLAPDSDDDAARVLAEVQRLVPRDWLASSGRRFLTARNSDVGGYDAASRTVSVADLGDGGRGSAAYALLAHLQQAQPDLVAAQEMYRFARTHTGRIGARRSVIDELLARLFSEGDTARADVLLPRALQAMFSGDWYKDDDLRAFVLGLLATR
ncbi:helicase-related protein [Streptomyces sp. NPDC093707]|uniref:helicase-related protein n=1 Tax=Streptomyces sp. NPDC093707 TaxID=3154984 RepID=UPI00344BA3FF